MPQQSHPIARRTAIMPSISEALQAVIWASIHA
jgi:hypothetical protein